MSNFGTYRHSSYGYDGGLHNSSSRRDIGRDQASVLENWDITFKGRLKSRKGRTLLGTHRTNTVYSSGVYQDSSGTHYLLINQGTSVEVFDTTDFVSIGTASTLSQAQRISFANVIVEDKIYFSSEDNGLNYWDGAGAGLSSVSLSPSGNVIMWYQNHLFHINNVNVASTKYPNRLYWSDFGNPEGYTLASSYIDLPGEGRAITMNNLGDSLVVFKESSYMFISGYGSASWALSSSSTSISDSDSSVGCLAPRGTVRVSANELWFIDNQGYIRRITQTQFGYESKVMSNNLDIDLNLGALENAVAAYDDNKIYFAVTQEGSSNNDLVLVFDRTASSRNGNKEAWTTYTGWDINDLIVFNNTLHIVGASSNKVFSHTGGDDDGQDIVCRWDGKNDDYDKPERYKKYAYGYMYSQAQGSEEVDIYASIDGKSFATIDSFGLENVGSALGPTGSATMGPTGSFILGGNNDIEEKYYFADGGGTITGKSVTMSIRASASQQIFVDTFTNHFVIRSLK